MRLLYLSLALCLLLGELPLTRLRSAYLFGLLVTNLKLPLDVFTGLLWILIPAMWGVLLFETVGLVPLGVSLFPAMHQPGRKWLIIRVCIGIGSVVLLAIALYATYNFYLLGQCQVLQVTCANDTDMQVTTVGWFGVLLILSGMVALWALVLGILGLLTIVFGVLSGMCYGLALLFGLAGHSMSTFGSPTICPFTVPFSAALPANTTDTLLLSAGKVTQPTEQENDPMNDVLRTNTFIGYGDLGYRMVPMALDTAQASGAPSVVLAVSILDLERVYRNQQPLNLPGHDISPSLELIKKALADESMGMAYTQLAYSTNDEIVKAYTTKHGGNIIIFLKLDLIASLSEPIRKLKMRLPKQHIVLVTMLPPLDQRGHELDEAYQDFLALGYDNGGDENGIETFILDQNAGFATQLGEETQERAAVLTLLGLCIAPLNDERNSTFAGICKRLGAYASLSGMAFAMAPVASGKAPFIWRMVKGVAPKAGDRGIGDFNDLLIQVKDCTEQVLHNAACLATPYPIDSEKPLFLLYSLPMALQDKRFKEAVAAIYTFLKRTYPRATGIIVRGNAVAAPGATRGYRCGVSALYPLPIATVTTDEEAIANTTEYTATQEKTPPTSQNGSKRRQSITS